MSNVLDSIGFSVYAEYLERRTTVDVAFASSSNTCTSSRQNASKLGSEEGQLRRSKTSHYER